MSDTIDYFECDLQANLTGEEHDCTIKSLSVALQLHYRRARALLATYGREPTGRMYHEDFKLAVDAAAAARGLSTLRFYVTQRSGRRYTMRTIGRALREDLIYMVFVKGHVMTFRDGETGDWTSGRLHRVLEVWVLLDSSKKTASPADLFHANPQIFKVT